MTVYIVIGVHEGFAVGVEAFSTIEAAQQYTKTLECDYGKSIDVTVRARLAK